MEEELIKYLDERHAEHLGELRFAYWKRIIKYKIKQRDYICRKMFLLLLDKNYFKKVNHNLYRYKEDNRNKFIITFK